MSLKVKSKPNKLATSLAGARKSSMVDMTGSNGPYFKNIDGFRYALILLGKIVGHNLHICYKVCIKHLTSKNIGQG